MTGTGTLSIGSIQYDNLLMTNAKSNVTMDHGLITMKPVTADLYGGKENGNIVLDMRGAQPVYEVNLKTEHVDANKLLSSVSSVKETLYGLLTSNVNAQFSSSSADAIARSLNGNLAINLANGKLMNVDLLHELASVGQFVGALPAAKDFTNIVQLSGTFDVQNGVAHTADLKGSMDFGTMAGTGSINLAEQSLNLRVTAVLNKELSQQVGGNQIGGYLNTALANNQGELVLPVTVTGTFQHPKVAPDFQQMAQLKLQNILPSSKNLGGLLGNKNGQQGGVQGVLDQIGGKNQQQQPSNEGANKPQEQQQKNPVGDVLNQVLGKKKKPEPTPTPPQ
jgi:AsmA protein